MTEIASPSTMRENGVGGAVTERRSLVVALSDDRGHTGYGESPPFDLPFYSEETLASARDVIARILLPRVQGRGFESPEAVDDALRENVDQLRTAVRTGHTTLPPGVGQPNRPSSL